MEMENPGVELAELPRERAGPFLVLGVPKDAEDEAIEAHWAQRVLWARQGKTSVPLEEIHWARLVLRDPDRRLAADSGSLNPDTAGNDLRRLAQSYHLDPPTPVWAAFDPEPPTDTMETLPDAAEVLAGIPAPSVPIDLPAVGQFLEQFSRAPVDPWGFTLPPPDPPQEPAP